jgi:HK97 family phage major capsid protein
MDEIEKKFSEALKPVADGIKGLNATLAELKAEQEKHASRMDQFEVKMKKGKEFGTTDTPEITYRGIFEKKLRNLTLTAEEQTKFLAYPMEQKLLSVANNAAAGILAPIEMWQEILKQEMEFSPFRPLCRVVQVDNRSIQIPKKVGHGGARWVNEIGARTNTGNPSYGIEEIPTHEMSAVSLITQQMIEDAKYPIIDEMTIDMAEQMRLLEDEAFLTGDGVGKPEGLLANPDVLANQVQLSGVDTDFTSDDLLELQYALKPGYARNGVWMMNRQTSLYIRKMKVIVNGEYAWQPGMQTGQPDRLFGRPVVENPDMVAPNPATGQFAKDDMPVIFGDFRRGYLIVDRVGLSITRDDVTQAENGQSKFVGRKRVGGQVIMPEAFVVLETD